MTLPESRRMEPHESEVFGQMARTMSYFHDHFKATWRTLYAACENNQRPANMSIRQFLNIASDFIQHLEMHHRIEEVRIFPLLAQRMPAFKREEQLLDQHKQIHLGLDELDGYLAPCKNGQREFRLTELKAILDKFGKVLWQHLDEEVENLSAENMKRYWSIDEMKRMPM